MASKDHVYVSLDPSALLRTVLSQTYYPLRLRTGDPFEEVVGKDALVYQHGRMDYDFGNMLYVLQLPCLMLAYMWTNPWLLACALLSGIGGGLLQARGEHAMRCLLNKYQRTHGYRNRQPCVYLCSVLEEEPEE